MQIDFIIKIAALFLTNFGMGITLIIAVNNDQFASPLKWSSLILFLGTILTSFFLWMVSAYNFILGLAVVNFISFLIIYMIVKNRDIGGINLAQRTLNYLTRLDTQVTFILNGLSQNKDPQALSQEIHIAFGSVLAAIGNIMGLGNSYDSPISIFITMEGKFRVLASIGMTPEHTASIQDKFCYNDEPCGLAGHAAYECKTISIPDLKNTKDPYFNKWVSVADDQEKVGSIICLPILRGLRGESKRKPIGVLSLSSKKEKVFESVPVRSLLNRFINKIEILLYCLELVETRMRPASGSENK